MSERTHHVLALNATGQLALEQRSTPSPSQGEVLVEVSAFGINRADLLQRAGYYPPPPGVDPSVLGLEFAGVVIEGSARWPVGSRVMGICSGCAYSQKLTAHERALIEVPEGWSMSVAAAFPEAYLTAFDALEQAELKAGERLLVHAVASGVGCAVAELGAWLGAEVVGTTRSEWKRPLALESLTLNEVCVLKEGDFTTLQAQRGELAGGFDVVIDFVGAAYLKQNLKVLREQGRLLVVGLLGGAQGELPLGLLLAKRARVQGTVLRSRPLEQKIALTQEVAARVMPSFIAGRLQAPQLHERVFEASVEGVEQAHELMRQNAHWGKLVCAW